MEDTCTILHQSQWHGKPCGQKQPPPARLMVQTNYGQRITTNPIYTTWQRQDQALISWLLSSMIKSIMGTMISCSSSFEVLIALERCFASQTKAITIQLKMHLQTFKKGSLLITEYHSKMKLLVDNLIAAGTIITDEELILYTWRTWHGIRLSDCKCYCSNHIAATKGSLLSFTYESMMD